MRRTCTRAIAASLWSSEHEVARDRGRRGSFWRTMSARGERGDAKPAPAHAVRALVDVELGDAQPEHLDGF